MGEDGKESKSKNETGGKKIKNNNESKKESSFKLMDRDYKIMQEIERWQICTGRHIRYLAGFSGQRACDRRLRKLIEAGFLERKKILYGVAGVYRNTYKVKTLIGTSREKKIRAEHLRHDITVLDVAIYINIREGISFESMKTERQLHSLDGFGIRKHRPDFVYKKDGETVCVEVELTLKAIDNFIKNMKSNFMDYDVQIWVVPDMDSKIARILQEYAKKYTNIEILELEEVKRAWRDL